MNRWWGSKSDSQQQASQRDQRAARRTISQLNLNPLSDEDEDNFEDCNTSINNTSIFANLDGQADSDSEEDSQVPEAIMPLTPAELAAQKALPFEDSDYPDHEDAWQKEIKIKFDKDVRYWFNTVEGQMKKFGINSQWSKKDAIVTLLPENVTEECKPILRLSQEDAGTHVYRDLKKEILSLFGPKDEDSYAEAKSLTLTGRPSALGKRLIHILCPGPKPFDGCHCAKFVYGMWLEKMSPQIKTAIARMKFNQTTYKRL